MVDPVPTPKSKFDIDCVDHLATLPISHWQHLIPDLLTWLQDWNWPIASHAKDLLIQHPDECVPELEEILQTNDTEWKYWILINFVPEMPVRCQRRLVPAMKKLRAETREESEDDWESRREGVDPAIDELLDSLGEKSP